MALPVIEKKLILNKKEGGNVMSFQLFLRLDGLNYYGDIPEIPEEPNEMVEEYFLSFEDIKMILNDIDSIDDYCNALLDYGDVEFFDCEKCKKLNEWIDRRVKDEIEPRYLEILKALETYCSRAIELNSGVVIEL